MRDTAAIRLRNLRNVVAGHGGQTVVARKLGKTKGWISQLVGERPDREITERTARSIEQALGLDDLSLDQESVQLEAIPPIEASLTLSASLAVLGELVAVDERVQVSEEKFVELCRILYRQAGTGFPATRAYIEALVQLAAAPKSAD